MKTLRNALLPITVLLLLSATALADTVNAIWDFATDVPVTANGYTATGNTVNFTLNFAPETGTDLTLVKNTGLDFIVGTFDNLAQGQAVALSYGGVTYRFVADYYGGSGNDLVLAWANSRVFAWGNNARGELGDGTTTNRPLPVPITATGLLAGKTVLAMAAGQGHSLALCSDGTLAAWGINWQGALGNNTTNDSLVPVAVNTASGVSALYGKTVVAIAAGFAYSLALCSDGTVAAWGLNRLGQLGDNTTNTSLVPVAVNTTSGVSALYGKTVVAIAAGCDFSLALCSDGTVAGWGDNYFGQLGDTTSMTLRYAPVSVNTASGVSALYGKTVVAIAAGDIHSLALCSDGAIASWGGNDAGQLGDTTTTFRNAPVLVNTASGVSALYDKTVVAIAAATGHSGALCSDGTVATWGYNAHGALGDGTTINRLQPVAVTTAGVLTNKRVVTIAAGASHTVVLCSDPTAAAWGWNREGELGDGTITTSDPYGKSAPVAVNTASLSAGECFAHVFSGSYAYHTLALVAAPPAPAVTLTDAGLLSDGSFRFAFTNNWGAPFGVLATTNPTLPVSNWTSLTGLTEVSPGHFEFADPQATNSPRRFYRVQSP